MGAMSIAMLPAEVGAAPAIRQPDELRDWHVVFFERATFWWARFVPGRFKHVAAYARSEACRTTVIYDVTLAGTRIYVLPDGPAGDEALNGWLAGAMVVRPPSPASGRRAEGASPASRPRLAFYCVPAIRHLIGARCGALTPTGLYRALIEQGAEIVSHGIERGAADAEHIVHPHRAERAGG